MLVGPCLAGHPLLTTFETSPSLMLSFVCDFKVAVWVSNRQRQVNKNSSCSLGLDAKDIVADFHECEHVDLGRNRGILRLCKVELWVGQSCESYRKMKRALQFWVAKIWLIVLTFTALLLADMARVLQIIQGEDILHLSLCVDDGARSILDAGLDLLSQELFHVVWLLVRQKRGQVLKFKWNRNGQISNRDSNLNF